MNPLVLDSCVWVNGLLGVSPSCSLIIDLIVSHKQIVIVSSYIIVEVTTVLRRLAIDLKISSVDIERSFWSIINLPNVQKEFSHDIKQSLLNEIRNQDEIVLLAKVLNLESKDTPFIVLCFKHHALLVTEDYRSLWLHRLRVKDLVGIDIILSD